MGIGTMTQPEQILEKSQSTLLGAFKSQHITLIITYFAHHTIDAQPGIPNAVNYERSEAAENTIL